MEVENIVLPSNRCHYRFTCYLVKKKNYLLPNTAVQSASFSVHKSSLKFIFSLNISAQVAIRTWDIGEKNN